MMHPDILTAVAVERVADAQRQGHPAPARERGDRGSGNLGSLLLTWLHHIRQANARHDV
ncbi:hypothetical protein FHX37_2009 [Haloactinospora alba]|uniref:Uncharacterized protein n=1 Tax=Haloactinospora alba TaxID=405555 RepID=A0A543NJP3_9ACTN|nr:hypothetical protein [Haloactinospora alba]TQN32083.1 hypothetical protein FHX37_2009 [Haloactinospora alba]